jgi:hypothetical protein
MTLVDDYLRAVALLLPRSERDDITAELRDIILTRIEAREAGLRRPLDEAETEAVLREVGHPLVVAARYRGGPRQAVGPALYPYWAFGVKAALVMTTIVSGAAFVVRVIEGWNIGSALGAGIYSVLQGLIVSVGVATLAAWLVERSGYHIAYLDRWRVRDLRGLEFASWDLDDWGRALTTRRATKATDGLGPVKADNNENRPRRPARTPADRAIAAIVGSAVFLLWWLGGLGFGLSGLFPAPGGLDWSAIKAQLFWPVLVYYVLIIGQQALILAWPRRRMLLGATKAAMGAALLAGAAWAWLTPPLGPVLRGRALAQSFEQLGRDPTSIAVLTVVVLAYVGAVRMLQGLWRMLTPAT